MAQTSKLLPFFNVTAGGTATLSLTGGPTYDRIILSTEGSGTLTKAQITGIRIRVNSKVIFETTGADLDAMNSYTGMASDPTKLTIDFTEIYARDWVGQGIGALGTIAGVASIMVEVDLAMTVVNPKLAAWAVTSGPKKLGVMNKLLRYPVNIGAAGKWPVQLPFGANGTLYKRIYVKSNTMTALEVKRNGVTIHDTEKSINEFIQKEHRKSPQAGWWVFDPTVDNNMQDLLDTSAASGVGSFEFNITTSGPEAVTIYCEVLDILENL